MLDGKVTTNPGSFATAKTVSYSEGVRPRQLDKFSALELVRVQVQASTMDIIWLGHQDGQARRPPPRRWPLKPYTF